MNAGARGVEVVMSATITDGHRAWPALTSPWVMHMTWADVCFLHWPVDAALLARRIPRGLQLDTHGGKAYLTLTPLRMLDTRPRLTPAIPGVSNFLELNVRTYVTDPRSSPEAAHKPGVYFFSLDCDSALAVASARAAYHLNYIEARMSFTRSDDGNRFEMRSERMEASFAAQYGPRGNPYHTKTGTLERFLTDRYCLYADSSSGGLYRAEIDHEPWTLRSAEAVVEVNTMAAPLGIELPRVCPLVQYAEKLEVHGWLPERVNA